MAEETIFLGNLTFVLQDGDNTFEIVNYSASLSVKYAAKNDFTDIFATKAEMKSSIKQTSDEISLEVSKKVNENEVISKINQSAEQISIEADKISLSGKTLNLGEGMSIVSDNFNVNSEGNMTCKDATFDGGHVRLYKEGNETVLGLYTDKTNNPELRMLIFDESIDQYYYNELMFRLATSFYQGGAVAGGSLDLYDANGSNTISLSGSDGLISCVRVVQTSLEENKENFEKLENALEIIKSTDIYKYNLKIEDDKSKKHIGFVIGDKYNYSKEITSLDNDGVDIYSMVSVAYKAIQEQQEQIEQLEQRIKELEEK